MMKEATKYGEAFDICKEYFLDDLCPPVSPFKLAEALLRAYKDGAKEHSVESGQAKTCDCEGPMVLEKSYCTLCGRDIYPPAV